MKPDEHIEHYKGHATDQITVHGKVDPEFITNVSDLSVSHTNARGGILSTITGEMKDQEALSGILNILMDNQFNVISVMKIDQS